MGIVKLWSATTVRPVDPAERSHERQRLMRAITAQMEEVIETAEYFHQVLTYCAVQEHHNGTSWHDIGSALGITAETAQALYARAPLVKPGLPPVEASD